MTLLCCRGRNVGFPIFTPAGVWAKGRSFFPDWDLKAKKSMCRNILGRLYRERKILLSRGGLELASLEYERVWLTDLWGLDISVFLDTAQICLLLFPPHATADFLSHLHYRASFLTCINLKTSHNLKIESCFIWWKFLEPQTQDTASWVTLRELLQGRGAGVRLYRSLQQGACSLNTKLWFI